MPRTPIIALLLALLTACAPRQGRIDIGALTIYEVNLRQNTSEGTLDAFREHLPRLADTGVGVLWLMPIHPIGEVNRKGSLGSYYAASDYLAVNPEFGTLQDFREFVDAAHGLGMLVILDWVPNHTAWDHEWTRTHPERFTKNERGEFTPPNADWTDVIDLNYDEPSTRRAMTDAMLFWIREFGVDGYRADVAEAVPEDYWRSAIAELRAERNLFMLAEGNDAWLHDVGFDATYGWGLGDTLLAIARGEADATAVRDRVERDASELAGHGRHPFRMYFISNHDWNSWNGVAIERFGPMWEAATVLTFTLPGMPLIYAGQEAGLDKQLAFFEKDEVDWRPDPAADLYRRLAHLKRSSPALRHGANAGDIEFIPAGDPTRVVAFRRSSAGDEVVVLANLSAQPADLPHLRHDSGARCLDLFGFPASPPTSLSPWEWTVLRRTEPAP